MSLMISVRRGHVMPGGDRPFSMLLTLCFPQNPAGDKALPLTNLCIFSMTSTILIGQWPNLLTFRGGDHASATPLDSDKMATRAKKAKTKSRYQNKFKTEWSAEFTS